MSATSKRNARGSEVSSSSRGRSNHSGKVDSHSSSTSKRQSANSVSNGNSRLSSANSSYIQHTNGEMEENNESQSKDDNQGEDEYSDDYDEDFEDDFESETEGSYADTYNEDYDESTRYEGDNTQSQNVSSSYAEKRLNLEVRQVKQSMMEENQHKGSTKKTPEGTATNEANHGNKKVSFDPLNRSFINFSSAKQRQSSKILAGKTRQRGDELLTMIRLGK